MSRESTDSTYYGFGPPVEKYYLDAPFRAIVDAMYQSIRDGQFTADEIRDAATLAENKHRHYDNRPLPTCEVQPMPGAIVNPPETRQTLIPGKCGKCGAAVQLVPDFGWCHVKPTDHKPVNPRRDQTAPMFRTGDRVRSKVDRFYQGTISATLHEYQDDGTLARERYAIKWDWFPEHDVTLGTDSHLCLERIDHAAQ